MKMVPSSLQQSARLRSDLKLGLPVIITDNDNCSLVLAVETLTEQTLIQVKSLENKNLQLILTSRRAKTLNAIPYVEDLALIQPPQDFSYRWLKSTANPALDLKYPMKGPFKSIRDASPNIPRAAIELCKKTQLLPAALVLNISKNESLAYQKKSVLTQDFKEIISQSQHVALLKDVSNAELPLEGMGKAKVHVFRDNAGLAEHYAIEIGNPSKIGSVLVRLHSACFTGDVIGSLKCDCGFQLKTALKKIAANGSGILIYLNQEGRGIGLANKMRAYELQNQGFDTVEANHRLGFEDEERDLRIGAQIIGKLGFKNIRLMTNNPKKVKSVADMGINITERLELITTPNDQNDSYLSTKAKKSGHLL